MTFKEEMPSGVSQVIVGTRGEKTWRMWREDFTGWVSEGTMQSFRSWRRVGNSFEQYHLA